MNDFKQANLAAVAPTILSALPDGVFLTVAHGNNVNTMTIGWATLGRMWGKPICVVPVRFSRYTRQLIEKADSFSLSIPLEGEFARELEYCGTKSGRKVDKYRECNLKLRPGATVTAPTIDGCPVVLECRNVHKQTLAPMNLAPEIVGEWYTDNDYHMLFYGAVIRAIKME